MPETDIQEITHTWKFVDHDIGPLVDLRDSFPYRMRLKVDKGEKLTQEEKDELFHDMQRNSRAKYGIPLGGWLFSFSDYCRTYYVEFRYGGIEKVWSPNKTAIRNFDYFPPIMKIQEVNQ